MLVFAMLLASACLLRWQAHRLAWPALLAGAAAIVAGLLLMGWISQREASARPALWEPA